MIIFIHRVIRKICRIITTPINNYLIRFFQSKPIDKKLVVFESEGDLSDNAFALFDYLYKNKHLDDYKTIWLVDNINEAKSKKFKNTVFVKKWPNVIEIKRDRYLATCKLYIYDHCNLLSGFKKREGQKIVYLTHGGYLKKTKEGESQLMFNNTDELYVTGKMFKHVSMVVSRLKNDQVLELGFPRIDYFFMDNSDALNNYVNLLGLANYEKVLMWMPTYRKSTSSVISENYHYTDTGLPLLKKEDDIDKFNNFLKDINTICLFKIHHLQMDMPCFDKKYTNLIIISDDVLQENSVQLYELIKISDALITDFSSVGFDYMIRNKPIIYATDDYEDYANSRGFLFDISKCMAGIRCENVESFYDAIRKVRLGIDEFEEERINKLSYMHTYIDGNASKRIAEHLGFIRD